MKISNKELEAILLRLQRTGCYRLHTYEDNLTQRGVASGDTTVIFRKIYEILED